MNDNLPPISVVIPTRNRGAAPRFAVESILANRYPDFEVILVDQSTNSETADALAHLSSDPRFRYIPSDKVGTGWARWTGVNASQYEIIAMTDDDCLVPPQWLAVIGGCFAENGELGLIFTQVDAGEHDGSAGYVPHFPVERERLVCRLSRFVGHIGMGASMAMRRDFLISSGGFDRNLGPGSEFHSGEDLDIAIRALAAGWCVLQTNRTAVIHEGFRAWDQYRKLTRRDTFAAGATFAKHIKCGNWAVLPWLLHWSFFDGILFPLSKILKGRAPRGLKRFAQFWQGFAAGYRAPVDRLTFLFAAPDVQANPGRVSVD